MPRVLNVTMVMLWDITQAGLHGGSFPWTWQVVKYLILPMLTQLTIRCDEVHFSFLFLHTSICSKSGCYFEKPLKLSLTQEELQAT